MRGQLVTAGHVGGAWLSRSGSLFDLVRLLMLFTWIFVVTVVVTAGYRASDLGSLRAGLASGDIASVRISPGLPADAQGSLGQTVSWQSGVFHYRTRIQLITHGDENETSADVGIPVVRSHDFAASIAREYPTAAIARVEPSGLSYAILFGFEVPMWLVVFALIGAVGTLVVLVSGPAPWRATRWAWFWLMALPIGPPLFLLLSGPSGPVPDVRSRRRLTGGWALLMVLLLWGTLLAL